MDTLASVLAQAGGSPLRFTEADLRYVASLLGRLDAADVSALIDRLEAARRHGRTVFLIGNGGSASTAPSKTCTWCSIT